MFQNFTGPFVSAVHVCVCAHWFQFNGARQVLIMNMNSCCQRMGPWRIEEGKAHDEHPETSLVCYDGNCDDCYDGRRVCPLLHNKRSIREFPPIAL